ncbi:MAG: LPS-assembly protein LptD [Myxococcales bacterium]|nr:LPS-assembly protein LptD [Myxococcales bacterium]
MNPLFFFLAATSQLLADLPSCGLEASRIEVEGDESTATDVRLVCTSTFARHRLSATEASWSQGRLRLMEPVYSTCDEPAAWSISARRASLVPEEGLLMEWPAFRIGPVPVMVLPAAYVPLSDRKSGVLLPTIQRLAPIGWELAVPLYWAPRRDLDFTVAPAVATRRGASVWLEARGAPSPKTFFDFQSSVWFDQGERRGPDYVWARESPIVRTSLQAHGHRTSPS